MSFLQGENAVLILTEGTARVDNRKYKDTFHVKAKMIAFDQVEEVIGHAPGGVCPFGINDDIEVYLDESLKKFDTVYPAAGNDHSAVKLTIPELEQIAGAKVVDLIFNIIRRSRNLSRQQIQKDGWMCVRRYNSWTIEKSVIFII